MDEMPVTHFFEQWALVQQPLEFDLLSWRGYGSDQARAGGGSEGVLQSLSWLRRLPRYKYNRGFDFARLSAEKGLVIVLVLLSRRYL